MEDDRVIIGKGNTAAAKGRGRLGDGLRGSLIGQRVEVTGLADVPVLAEAATEVAAGRPEGQHRRSRQEVIQRLFLDRIDTETAGAAITGQHDLPVLASPHEAEAALALVQFAQARTQITLDAPVIQSVPVAGCNDRGVLGGIHGNSAVKRAGGKVAGMIDGVRDACCCGEREGQLRSTVGIVSRKCGTLSRPPSRSGLSVRSGRATPSRRTLPADSDTGALSSHSADCTAGGLSRLRCRGRRRLMSAAP